MTKLHDIFGVDDITQVYPLWPSSHVLSKDGGDPAPIKDLIDYLEAVCAFTAVRGGLYGDHVGLSAEVQIDPAPEPAQRHFVLATMPQLSFQLLKTADSLPARLFVTRSPTGVELVIEDLPVAIALPSSMLSRVRPVADEDGPPDPATYDSPKADFESSFPDSFSYQLYDSPYDSLIQTHVRVRMTEEFDFVIELSVPISIGPCRFLGFPCRAVHDLALVSSPHLPEGDQALEWARHAIDLYSFETRSGGLFTARTVDFDLTRTPLIDLLRRFNKGDTVLADPDVNIVLEDVAWAFGGALPIPSHGTFGLRRNISNTYDLYEAFDLSNAPVSVAVGTWGTIYVDRLLLRTPATADDQSVFAELRFDVRNSGYAITVGLSDDWTLHLGIKFKKPGRIFSLAGIDVSVWSLKAGISLRRAVSVNPHYSIKEQLQVLGDLGITGSPSALSDFFRITSESGKDLDIVLRDVGWSLGQPSLGGFAAPEGVAIVVAGFIFFIAEEIVYASEANGAQYVSFSGGVEFNGLAGARTKPTAGGAIDTKDKSAGVRFHRLRFRTAGAQAPSPLLDGVTIQIHWGVFSLDGFGTYTAFDIGQNHFWEFGFGIKLGFHIGKDFLVGLQFFYGECHGNDNFKYWMAGLQYSPIPLFAGVQLENLRALAAGNLTPQLDPPDDKAPNMRLFYWYKHHGRGTLVIPGGRTPLAWLRRSDSFAIGVGLGVSIIDGRTVRLDAFVFYESSPEQTGLMVALEVFIGKGTEPCGFGAFEYDFTHDKWGFLIGVQLTIKQVIDSDVIPSWLADCVSLTGTMYAGNQPGTFAIGQLNDHSTWLTLRFDPHVFAAKVIVALCLQIVEGGPKGFGLYVSLGGGLDFYVGFIQFYITGELFIGPWKNQSTATGFIVWIEAGVKINLLVIFEFGAHIKIEVDYLNAPDHEYWRAAFEVRIDTPWFLPSIGFTVEKVTGDPHPEQLPILHTPVTGASALRIGAHVGARAEIGVTALAGVDPAQTVALAGLPPSGSDPIVDESARAAILPVGVDATIAVDYRAAVDDQLASGENTPSAAGTQVGGDLKNPGNLTTRFELVSMAIRRRPLYNPSPAWTDLLTTLDTTIPSLSQVLNAHYAPTVKTFWDRDVVNAGRLEPNRLLINADTPYSIGTDNPEADEALASSDPSWPCCSLDVMQPGERLTADALARWTPWHGAGFAGLGTGERVPSEQKLDGVNASLRWLTPLPPVVVAGAARVRLGLVGDNPFAMVVCGEPVVHLRVGATWAVGAGTVVADAFRGLDRVATTTLALSWPPTGAAALALKNDDGFDSVYLRYQPPPTPALTDALDVNMVEVRTVAEQRDTMTRGLKCTGQRDRIILGDGRFAWLPNHDYEIMLTTRITANVVSSTAQQNDVKQILFFRTRGPLGLNAVARTGDEIQPYVESVYPPGPPARLYRTEPTAIAFTDKFNLLLPLDRPAKPADPAEVTQKLVEWALAIDQSGGVDGGVRLTQTTPDWIVANRGPRPGIQSRVVDSSVMTTAKPQAATLDPMRLRLQRAAAASTACPPRLPAPSTSHALLHWPIDPAMDPAATGQKWPASTQLRVHVRDQKAPFVDRSPFDADDLAAFRYIAGPGGQPWSFVDGAVAWRPPEASGEVQFAPFGDTDWQHVQVHTLVDPGAGAAGVAVAVSGAAPNGVTDALYALVGGGRLRLIARVGDGAGSFNETVLDEKPLGAAAPPAEAAPLAGHLRYLSLPGHLPYLSLHRSRAPVNPVGTPVMLEVIAFDDRVRAAVGNVAVDAPRGSFRAGRLALVAQDAGTFTTLTVEGIDAYAYDVLTSRYATFAEHVASFDWRVPLLDSAAPGASPFADAFSQLGAGIAIAMAPDTSVEGRQGGFDAWLKALALPVRQRVDGLRLSRFGAGGHTDVILLESPEPLPLGRDVTLTVTQRRRRPWITPVTPPRPVPVTPFVPTPFRPPVIPPPSARVVTEHFIWPHAIWQDVTLPVVILTNGDETRALILPVDAGGVPTPLTNGSYDLEFHLDRARVRSDVPSPTTNYRDKAKLTIHLG